MDNFEDSDRRIRDEQDQGEDIRATVLRAKTMIELDIMSEKEALKYFNITKAVYDKYREMV